MLKNIKNKLGQYETYRTVSGRYNAYGCVKRIDKAKGLLYFDIIFFEDESIEDKYMLSPEEYINYTNAMKELDIKEGEWISFRGTLVNYSVPSESVYGGCDGLCRFLNVRAVKRMESNE